MNFDEIMARLQSGETPDSIAGEFTKALNLAQKTYEEEKEAKRKEEEKKEKRNSIADVIADDFNYFYNEYYKDDGEELHLNGKDIVEILDHVNNAVSVYDNIFDTLMNELNKIFKEED